MSLGNTDSRDYSGKDLTPRHFLVEGSHQGRGSGPRWAQTTSRLILHLTGPSHAEADPLLSPPDACADLLALLSSLNGGGALRQTGRGFWLAVSLWTALTWN